MWQVGPQIQLSLLPRQTIGVEFLRQSNFQSLDHRAFLRQIYSTAFRCPSRRPFDGGFADCEESQSADFERWSPATPRTIHGRDLETNF